MNVDRRLLFACGLAALSACDTGADRPATWSYLHETIFAPDCATASCHSYQRSAGGIDLSTSAGAYAVLTGHTCDAPAQIGDAQAPKSFVWPGHPDDSELIRLLTASRIYLMPPDVPLPPVEVNLVRQWIYEGAQCDTDQ
jgi:hypothetical protein